jgi:hypothetical protein
MILGHKAALIAAMMGPHISRVVIADSKHVLLFAHATITPIISMAYRRSFKPVVSRETCITDDMTQAVLPWDAA